MQLNMLIPFRWRSYRHERLSSLEPEKAFEESNESLLENVPLATDDHEVLPPQTPSRKRLLQSRLITTLNLAILVLSLILNFDRITVHHEKNFLLKKLSFYSPGLDWFEFPSYTAHFKGNFFMPDEAPIARKFPSAEVEEYWGQYDASRMFAITAEQVVKLGKDPLSAVKIPQELGYGDDAYFAAFDVYHQLHCLNSLRKIAYKDYEPFPTVIDMPRPQFYWPHVAHCIHFLHENIKCSANLDMVTWIWRQNQTTPTLDFDVNHQCRDWNALSDFAEAHELRFEDMKSVRRPEDPSQYIDAPLEKGWWDYMGPNPKTDLPPVPTLGIKYPDKLHG